MRKFLFLLLIPVFIGGCSKNQAEADDKLIKQYISDHHLGAIAEPNGLYYVPHTVGTGAYPVASSQVTLTYKGYFTSGTIFSQSNGIPLTFTLDSTIAGWQEGIELMQKGGSATLLIPSALAYGSQGVGSTIPPNSVLIYDIGLVSFQ